MKYHTIYDRTWYKIRSIEYLYNTSILKFTYGQICTQNIIFCICQKIKHSNTVPINAIINTSAFTKKLIVNLNG